MNVLGKIKSKKNIVNDKTQNKDEIKNDVQIKKNQKQESTALQQNKSQYVSKQKSELKSQNDKNQQNQMKSLNSQKNNNPFQTNKQKASKNQKNYNFCSNNQTIRQYKQFETNHNYQTKNKQKQTKHKGSIFTTATTNSFYGTTSNSISSSLSHLNKNKIKQNKKPGVYFEGNPALRQNSMFGDRNSLFVGNRNSLFGKQGSKNRTTTNSIPSHESNQQLDEQVSLDFDFLLTNREKKQIKKSLHLSKGKMENIKSIQEQLMLQSEQVLCFIVKKWHFYGDIYMFEGQLQSLKRRYILIDLEQKSYKVYDRMKIKISCQKDMIIGPQAIGRLYLSQVIFLSQNQGMIDQGNLLKIIEKSLKIKKK